MEHPTAPVLTFLGGAGTVTGSRFLIETDRARLLVDCGMFQGLKRLRLANWDPFPVDPASIDAVVLSHAHLDHSGYLPALARDGFAGPVWCTAGTADLAGIVLTDSGHLQEEEAAYANRKGFSRHRPALPLYTAGDAERCLHHLRDVPFDAPVAAAPGVEVRFSRAGHILGSSSVLVRLERPARTILVSGDLGRPVHPILRPPPAPPDADVVLVESTYGDRHHEDADAAVERLADAVRRTAARGGVVVIPAFAVDRVEVLLLALRRLRAEGRIPALPVYADSPMALAVLDVYRKAIAGRDPEVRLEPAAGADPFDPGDLREIHSPAESRALNDVRYPSVIISSSGMATGGRVLHHLAQRLPDPRNTVVIAGFQAEGTRGRQLADGAPAVKLLGRYVPVRAEILDVGAFSVHADADELLAWLARAPRPPDTVYVVHGEQHASDELCRRIRCERGWHAVVPAHGDRVRVD